MCNSFAEEICNARDPAIATARKALAKIVEPRRGVILKCAENGINAVKISLGYSDLDEDTKAFIEAVRVSSAWGKESETGIVCIDGITAYVTPCGVTLNF